MADEENRLGVFLRARREQVRPEDVGVPDLGRRRVPGLRREELAMLAGVSADYYVRLEQGRDRHPSDQVVEALARVLGLDDDAVAHLHELARPSPRRRRAARRPERVSAGLAGLLVTWDRTPAFVLGRRLDVLAANPLAAALCPSLRPGGNMLRSTFLDPETRAALPAWERAAKETVASLRASVGADLDDPQLTELVGELSLKSPEFGRLWARHDVLAKTSGEKRYVHPIVGDVDVSYESFAVGGATGQLLIVYHAVPGSPSERALALLASLAGGEGERGEAVDAPSRPAGAPSRPAAS